MTHRCCFDGLTASESKSHALMISPGRLVISASEQLTELASARVTAAAAPNSDKSAFFFFDCSVCPVTPGAPVGVSWRAGRDNFSRLEPSVRPDTR